MVWVQWDLIIGVYIVAVSFFVDETVKRIRNAASKWQTLSHKVVFFYLAVYSAVSLKYKVYVYEA